MKNISIALATLVLGIGAVASAAQAGPGGSAGYPDASPAAYIETPAAPTYGQIIDTAWVGNDGDVCRNLNLTCRGIGHGPIGWDCTGCGFSGWWSAD